MPKVYANLFSRSRPEGTPAGSLLVTLEYVFLDPPQRSGKCLVTVDATRNENRFTDDLKDALVVHLNARFAPDEFAALDIIGCGV